MAIILLTSFLIGCTGLAQASCALSGEPQPNGAIGLQLFYADQARAWNDADDLGVSFVRVELRWDFFEPRQGQFEVDHVDRVMALANQHRQTLLLLFNYPPQWAVNEPDLLPARAANALQWLVRRHGARVSAWEIFNEPNLESTRKFAFNGHNTFPCKSTTCALSCCPLI